MEVPKEHGFWVMLGITVLSGIATAPSLNSVLAAVALVVVMVLAAMFIGRGIRKNSLLQAMAAVAMGGAVVGLGLAGGGTVGEVLFVACPLTFVFVVTTVSVQGLLLRARRKRHAARGLAWGAVVLGIVGAGTCQWAFGWRGAVAVALSALVAIGFVASPPSPKKLKRVGLTIAGVQLLAALVVIV